MMTEFHKKWLRLANIGVVLFGVAIALFAFPATEAPMRMFFELLGQPIDATPDKHFRFAIGLMGCVSIGWGLTLLFVCEAAHQLRGRVAVQIWRGIGMALGVWFVTDSCISILTGFWRNAISNIVLIILLMIPLLSSGVLKSTSSQR